MFTTRPVCAAGDQQVGLPAEKRGYLQHVGDLGHRSRVSRPVDIGQHRDADVPRTLRRIRRPSARPGPRNDPSDVRLPCRATP